MTDAPPAFARAVRDPGSFRDPSGFVYRRDGVLYRQVNQSFADRWDDLVASGLLDRAPVAGSAHPARDGAHRGRRRPRPRPRGHPTGADPDDLLPVRVVVRDAQGRGAGDARRAGRGRGARLRPPRRDRLQRPVPPRPADPHRHALVRATASRATPWIAYRQFCEHFLAPLALMARRDVRLGLLLRDHIDGIPLDLAARLLPGRSRWNLGLGAHIHAHARAQGRYADAGTDAAAATKKATVSEFKQQALIDSLRRTIAKLDWTPEGTEWADYADNTSYGDAGTAAKEELVGRFLADAGGAVVWDLGANTGRYSRIAAGLGRDVVVLGHRPGRGRAELPPGPARRRRARPAARARPRQPQPGPRLGERGAALRARAGERRRRPRARPRPPPRDRPQRAARPDRVLLRRRSPRSSSSSSCRRTTRWSGRSSRRARTSSTTTRSTASGRRSTGAWEVVDEAPVVRHAAHAVQDGQAVMTEAAPRD